MIVFEVGERDIAPLASPVGTRRPIATCRGGAAATALAIEVSLLIAIACGAAYFSLRSPDAIAFGKRDWVVVGDLIQQDQRNAFQ